MDDTTRARRATGEMPLLEHLLELRSRLIRALAALAVGTVVGYALFPYVLTLLLEPYCLSLLELRPDDECTLVALSPFEPFAVRIRTALVIGLFVGGPVIFYQLWRFVTPGLTTRERRYALPFVVFSQLMFAGGIASAFVVIPQGLRVLLSLGGPLIEPLLGAERYLSFFLAMSVAFGIVFELPLVLVFLALAGIVTSRGLRRSRPIAIVLIFVVAAVVTPTVDALTLLFVAGPMVAFYELSIAAAWLIERRRRRRSVT